MNEMNFLCFENSALFFYSLLFYISTKKYQRLKMLYKTQPLRKKRNHTKYSDSITFDWKLANLNIAGTFFRPSFATKHLISIPLKPTRHNEPTTDWKPPFSTISFHEDQEGRRRDKKDAYFHRRFLFRGAKASEGETPPPEKIHEGKAERKKGGKLRRSRCLRIARARENPFRNPRAWEIPG